MHRLQVELVNTLGGNKAHVGNAALPQPRLRCRGSRLLALEEGPPAPASRRVRGRGAVSSDDRRRRKAGPVAPSSWWRHHWRMVSGRIRPIEADLFSTASLREAPSPAADPPPKASSTTDAATAASAQRHLLPKDLARAISHLSDQEFDRLLAAVLAERKRRGKKLPGSRKTTRKPASKEIGPPLTLAKLNAIRAAFKAGVTPSRIARRFGIAHADVRKALASGTSKRS